MQALTTYLYSTFYYIICLRINDYWEQSIIGQIFVYLPACKGQFTYEVFFICM